MAQLIRPPKNCTLGDRLIGRTSDSGSESWGSSPCPRALIFRLHSSGSIVSTVAKINIYRNPFIVGLWTPLYLLGFTICTTTDMLWVALFIMMTLGLMFAYVTEFPVVPGLYGNEVMHKVAVSSLLGIVLGFLIGIAGRAFLGVDEGTDTGGALSGARYFGLTWLLTATPGYFICVWRMASVNKRDLVGEQKVRDEKRKNRKKGGPPILNKDGGGL